jgi:hypothetical protein
MAWLLPNLREQDAWPPSGMIVLYQKKMRGDGSEITSLNPHLHARSE